MRKYINCEFGYLDKDGTNQLLIYAGISTTSLRGLVCSHCGKPLKSKAHTFNDEDGAEWLFGSECVKYVWGTGLTKLNESE